MVESETGWHMDLERLAGLVTPDTRLVVVNLPHNPTGYLLGPAEFEELLAIVGRHGTWLFCDEMYRGLEYAPEQRLPSAIDRYPRAVCLWGMSKTFGLAGLRIGWLATQDRPLMQSLMRLKDYTTICSSAPSELLARLALGQAESLIQRNLGIIQSNLEQARQFMARWPDVFAWRPPLAGPIAFVRLRQGSAAGFCETVVQGCGVLLVPSTMFDFGDQHMRWGFGRRNFPEGLAVLEGFLEKQ
jgi:aspartate/methionine/tyrosine aminotransferase